MRLFSPRHDVVRDMSYPVAQQGGKMGLQKSIEHNKEKRRPWPYYKMVDHACRNHGGCSWCYGNRTQRRRKVRAAMNAAAKDAEFEDLV